MDELYSAGGLDLRQEIARREQWLTPQKARSVVLELDRCGLSSHTRALDLGCGIGVRSLATARDPRVVELLGIDMHEPLVIEARARAQAAGITNAEFRVGDIRKTGLESASFHLVRIDSVLWTVPDARLVLDEAHRLLVPGGVLWASNHDTLGFDVLTYPPLPPCYQRFHERFHAFMTSCGADPHFGHRLASEVIAAGFVIKDADVDARQELGPQDAAAVQMHWEFIDQWLPRLAQHDPGIADEARRARASYDDWAAQPNRSLTRLKYHAVGVKRS